MTRINPHPSKDPRYDVEVVGPSRDREDMVIVRYINDPHVRWEVNDDVPEAWTVDE